MLKLPTEEASFSGKGGPNADGWQTTVFLDDMANFAEMNGRYEKFFSHKPARSCVAVKQLPKGVPVEIECIALAPGS